MLHTFLPFLKIKQYNNFLGKAEKNQHRYFLSLCNQGYLFGYFIKKD